MAGHYENRRVRMTKLLMIDALLELLEKCELSDISITAICEIADVHRSTFYRHYENPSDVLREIEQEFLERIPKPVKFLNQQGKKQLLAATTAFFDFVKQNKRYFRILFNESVNNNFTKRLVEFLCSGYLPFKEETDELSARFIRLYIAHGTIGMLREWIESDFPVSSQAIAEMMFKLSRKVSSAESSFADNTLSDWADRPDPPDRYRADPR